MKQIYNMWNQTYIQEVATRQYHNQQISQGIECVNKLKDLLDAMDKVDPAYQQMVSAEMCATLMEYFGRKNIL